MACGQERGLQLVCICKWKQPSRARMQPRLPFACHLDALTRNRPPPLAIDQISSRSSYRLPSQSPPPLEAGPRTRPPTHSSIRQGRRLDCEQAQEAQHSQPMKRAPTGPGPQHTAHWPQGHHWPSSPSRPVPASAPLPSHPQRPLAMRPSGFRAL